MFAMGLYACVVYHSSGVSNIFLGTFRLKLTQNIDINRLFSCPKYLPLKVKEGFNVPFLLTDASVWGFSVDFKVIC